MTLRAVALLLIAAGLVLNQYALVAVGLATIILGAFLLWRRSES
jgi:LPXTG-motif cell wall-anchored protein